MSKPQFKSSLTASPTEGLVDLDAVLRTMALWLTQTRAEMERVEQAYRLLAARPVPSTRNGRTAAAAPPSGGKFIADRVEQLLAEARRPLPIDKIVSELKERHNIRVTEKNLGNILNRWISKGRRFTRPAPNTFARRAA